MSDPAGHERERVLELLRRHGWNTTSFQVLEPGFSYWFDPAGRGCVAYVETAGAWVAAGAPIATADDLAAVTEAFTSAARASGRRTAFFGVEERFLSRTGCAGLLIGEQPVWDPREWDETLRRSRSLREQLRRARAKGLSVRRITAEEAEGPLRPTLEALADRWLRSRAMAPMGFLVQLKLFPFSAERRYWVAERGDQIVALLAGVPVFERAGWFLEDLVRDARAPNGTAEALVDAAMRELAAEGCDFATLGLAPLSGPVHPWMRAARDLGSSLYDFEGLRAFKARLRPKSWNPIFLARPGDASAALAVLDALRAFARGGLFRFGLATLLRGPAVVVRLLAVLLVPWTLALALVDWRPWFPSPGIRWAWVAFDVGLFAGLWALTARWRRGLATWMAALVTLDAVLTAIQATLFNVRHTRSPLEWAVLAVALAGPAVAAILLWGGRAHRR